MGDASKLRRREKNSWIKVNGFGRNESRFSKVAQFEEERGWLQMLLRRIFTPFAFVPKSPRLLQTSSLNPCKNLEMTKLRVCGSIGNDAGLTSLSSSIFRPFGVVHRQQVRLARNPLRSIDSMTRLLLPPMMISIVESRKCSGKGEWDELEWKGPRRKLGDNI